MVAVPLLLVLFAERVLSAAATAASSYAPYLPIEGCRQSVDVPNQGAMLLLTANNTGDSSLFPCVMEIRCGASLASMLVEEINMRNTDKSCTTGNYLKVGKNYFLCGSWKVKTTSELRVSGRFSDSTKINSFSFPDKKVTVQVYVSWPLPKDWMLRLLVVPYRIAPSCSGTEFSCSGSGQAYCIDKQLKCNGHFDCGSQSTADEDCELSAGAISGITVALLVAVTLIAAAVFYVIWRKRKSRSQNVTGTSRRDIEEF